MGHLHFLSRDSFLVKIMASEIALRGSVAWKDIEFNSIPERETNVEDTRGRDALECPKDFRRLLTC